MRRIGDLRQDFPGASTHSVGELKRLDYSSDVTVLENRTSALPCSAYGDFYHGPGQVVGPNHLVGEQHPKRGVDRAHKAVAEIRFLPRLHGINVRRSEEINAGEPGRKQCRLG